MGKYDNTGRDFNGDPDAELARRKADDDLRRREQDEQDRREKEARELREQAERARRGH